jgi:hypothetical protein
MSLSSRSVQPSFKHAVISARNVSCNFSNFDFNGKKKTVSAEMSVRLDMQLERETSYSVEEVSSYVGYQLLRKLITLIGEFG